jgi:hypothetical protein
MASTAPFDYGAPAELFSGAARPSRGQPMGYRRFASAAEALRFAIEELAPAALAGLDKHEMRRLYAASVYPLVRHVPKDHLSATTRLGSRRSAAVPGSANAKKRVRHAGS